MSPTTEQIDGVQIVRVQDEQLGEPQIEALGQYLLVQLARGERRFVLDLSRCREITQFRPWHYMIQRAVNGYYAKIRLLNPPDHFARLLDATQSTQLQPRFSDEQAAIASFQ